MDMRKHVFRNPALQKRGSQLMLTKFPLTESDRQGDGRGEGQWERGTAGAGRVRDGNRCDLSCLDPRALVALHRNVLGCIVPCRHAEDGWTGCSSSSRVIGQSGEPFVPKRDREKVGKIFSQETEMKAKVETRAVGKAWERTRCPGWNRTSFFLLMVTHDRHPQQFTHSDPRNTVCAAPQGPTLSSSPRISPS